MFQLTPSARALFLVTAAGCGGTVVFEESAGDGSGSSAAHATSPSTSVTTGGDGGADVASTANASSAASTVTVGSGPSDPCGDLKCGDDCWVCNDVECLDGSCNAVGVCSDVRECPLTECYVLPPDETCAVGDAAYLEVCRDCTGEVGCGFFGTILDGPFLEAGSCCYEVSEPCLPSPS